MGAINIGDGSFTPKIVVYPADKYPADQGNGMRWKYLEASGGRIHQHAGDNPVLLECPQVGVVRGIGAGAAPSIHEGPLTKGQRERIDTMRGFSPG
jgi:hypothetical protein